MLIEPPTTPSSGHGAGGWDPHRPLAHMVLFLFQGPIVGELSWFATWFRAADNPFDRAYVGFFGFSLIVSYFPGAVRAALAGWVVRLFPRWIHGSKRPHLLTQTAVGAVSGALLT